MTETVIGSATKEIIIGFDQPFCVIGERINPTGRKKLAAEMVAGNFATVIKDALAQAASGAHMLDVNAGVPLADEPRDPGRRRSRSCSRWSTCRCRSTARSWRRSRRG